MPLQIPTLITERLRLDAVGTQHATGMFELWSDPEVCRYSGTVRDYEGRIIEMPAADRSASDRIVEFWLHAARDGWGFRWAVISSDTGAFTGTVGFNSVGPCAEIAYHLLPAYWGRGIMTEACQAAINWQQHRGGKALEAFVEPDNGPSIAIAERLGFTATDTFSEGARRYQMDLPAQGFSAR